MTVTPLGDRVLLKRTESESQTSGGLYIPQTAKQKTQEAVVISIGESEDIPVKPGDTVLYDRYAGTNITIDDEPYLVLNADDILATLS